MWEDSMAQVAREQEVLEQKVGESEEKRKLTKRALREVIEGSTIISSRPESAGEPSKTQEFVDALEKVSLNHDGTALRRKSTAASSLRRKSILLEVGNLSETESDDDEEFFDAVDAGEVAVAPKLLPPSYEGKGIEKEKEKVAEFEGMDLSPSFKGYETGIRKKLKMDADDRPKISLWVSLSCEIKVMANSNCRAFSSR
jgi:hypothetical protein